MSSTAAFAFSMRRALILRLAASLVVAVMLDFQPLRIRFVQESPL